MRWNYEAFLHNSLKRRSLPVPGHDLNQIVSFHFSPYDYD
jgi:hypothetical protein